MTAPGTCTSRTPTTTASAKYRAGLTTTASSFSGTINPNGTLLLSTGDGIPSTAVGSANVRSTGSIPASRSSGSSGQAEYPKERAAPIDAGFVLENHGALRRYGEFPNRPGLSQSIGSPITVTATAWDQGGSKIDMQSFTLLANGHTAFNVASQWRATDNKQGIIVFQSNGGGLTGLGPRFSPFGTFTSVPSILSN